jgi:putative phosphoribosyl transferase
MIVELNRKALLDLTCEVELVIVPHATHSFEEPGALDEVAHLASDWFLRHAVVQPSQAVDEQRQT